MGSEHFLRRKVQSVGTSGVGSRSAFTNRSALAVFGKDRTKEGEAQKP